MRPPRRIAGHSLRCKFIKIDLPHGLLLAANLEEIVPRVDARGMHVVEHQPNGIVADRMDFDDHDVALAADCLALLRGMTLDFRARTVDAEELGGKLERLAVVEGNAEHRLVLAKPHLR